MPIDETALGSAGVLRMPETKIRLVALTESEKAMTNSIDHREKLSYEQFAKEYLYANKPVIITDALRDWKALRRWTPEFFK